MVGVGVGVGDADDVDVGIGVAVGRGALAPKATTAAARTSAIAPARAKRGFMCA
jgi:hypothetical protein